jgi:asparagine synthase (glutamine-hydrolysing)
MIPQFFRTNVIEAAVNALPTSTQNMSLDFKAKRFISSVAETDLVARHHSFFGSFTPHEQKSLLTDYVKSNNGTDIYAEARRWLKLSNATNTTEQMQFLDMKFYLAEDILTKVDRASMAVSLEVRAPFLDPRVADFSAGLPENYKLNGKKTKYILKKAVAPLLPEFVVKRPKKGFGIPVAVWLKGRLNPLLKEMLAPNRLKQQGLFNPAFVSKLITEHEQGKANHYKTLWTLLIFQLWCENFLQEK